MSDVEEIFSYYRYETPYRSTAYGGLDYYFAYCPKCVRFVKPRFELSKTGRHGKMIFIHSHELKFIRLSRSNSGKREIWVDPEMPFRIRRFVITRWMDFEWSHSEIEKFLFEKWGVVE